jgi:hypothetical protein
MQSRATGEAEKVNRREVSIAHAPIYLMQVQEASTGTPDYFMFDSLLTHAYDAVDAVFCAFFWVC